MAFPKRHSELSPKDYNDKARYITGITHKPLPKYHVGRFTSQSDVEKRARERKNMAGNLRAYRNAYKTGKL